MNSKEKVLETIKLMKSQGIKFSTRNEIFDKANVQLNNSNKCRLFKDLENNNHLKIKSERCGRKAIVYSLENVKLPNKNKTTENPSKKKEITEQQSDIHNIKWIKHENKILVDAIECLQYAGIEKEKALEYIDKIEKVYKEYYDLNDNLLLDDSGLLNLCYQVHIDESCKNEQLSKMLELKTKIGNVSSLNTTCLTIKSYDTKEDTYEDLDEIFDSLLKTVDTISIRVNNFKNVKDDREKQIRILESDKLFYKGKCEEYKRNVVRLQEKIDALKWG